MGNESVTRFRRFLTFWRYPGSLCLTAILLALSILVCAFFLASPTAESRAKRIRSSVAKKYSEDKVDLYLEWYKKGYREQIKAGKDAWTDIMIDGEDNFLMEEAYNRGASDAKEDLGD